MTTWPMLADIVAGQVAASRRAADRAVHGERDRVVDPAETLAVVRRLSPALGITRIGLVTGLDRVGVPIGAAYRPNSRSLSVNQGKGRDAVSALASAAMEAAEVAVAERDPAAFLTLSLAAAAAAGVSLVDLARVTRCRPRDVDRTLPRRLVAGFDLIAGAAVAVPFELVGLDHVDLPPRDAFDRSSDGLASGNLLVEAVLRGLHELVERDAIALMELLPDPAVAALKRAPGWFGDPWLDAAVGRLDAAAVDVALFDATSDFGVPVVAALLTPRRMERDPGAIEAGLTIGYGSDASVGSAAMRAVAEACQARVTAIAGARDDIGADRYRPLGAGDRGRNDRLAALTAAPAVDAPPRPALARDGGLWPAVDAVVARLAAGGIRQVVVVPMTAPDFPFAVCRVIVPGLEIGTGGPGRQPGARLLRAMLRSAA